MGRAVRGGYAIYAPALYLRNKQEIQNRLHHQKDACIHHGKKVSFICTGSPSWWSLFFHMPMNFYVFSRTLICYIY